jgi:hypothetical protein
MRRNSGLIGKHKPTSKTTAGGSGVHDTFDNYNARVLDKWPPPIKYLSITVNSSTSALSLNEGSSITVVVTTEAIPIGTLYYSISSVGGTVNTGDFTDLVITGSFTITSNTGTFTKTLTADGTSEAGDAFQVQIRTGSTSGPIVLTSSTITINNPVFTVSMGASTYNEGSSPYINFSATNWNTQTLYWRSSSTTDDNTGGLTQSTFSYTSGVTSSFFPYALKQDMITEGNETHTISIYNTDNTVLLASTTYTAVDTSLTPTVTESTLSINEGDSVTFTVTFPGGPTSGTIYWTTTGTMTANDFTDGVLSGTASISASGSNGVATITRTARRDYITDGAKSFGLTLYRDGVSTTPVYTGSSSRISVADTVQTPTITASATSINEGDSVTFTLTTTGVPDGTVFPYFMNTTVGSYSGTYDFTDALTSGNLTVTGNTASVTKTWANDTYTDGTQSYTLTIRPPVGSLLSTTTLATSPTIVVADTSSGTAVPALFAFTSLTFTTTGLRTTTGPTLAQCKTAYNTATYPWLNDTAYFDVTGGMQIWTVPSPGNYRITAKGAGGATGGTFSSSYLAGSGATMVGTFAFNQGEKINIAVGQMGISGNQYAGGGGGGSWVVKYGGGTVNDILVIAGGGSGVGYSGGATGRGASSTTTATLSGGSTGVATTGGNGGAGGSGSYSGGGGGGFLTNGGTGLNDGPATGGQSWLNGLVGGTTTSTVGSGNLNTVTPANGGFGGGGAGNVQGGGGGGYSGGNGGGTTSYASGGGGASYMSASATSTTLTNGIDGVVSSVNFASYYGTVLIEKL